MMYYWYSQKQAQQKNNIIRLPDGKIATMTSENEQHGTDYDDISLIGIYPQNSMLITNLNYTRRNA